MSKPTNPRKQLLSIYHSALRAANGRRQVAHFLQTHPCPTPLALIALGKAASQMALGAFDVLTSQIKLGFLVTKTDHLDQRLPQNYPMTCLEAAHPVPDASSLAAGKALLNFIQQLPPQYPILFLISGGTSALVEVLAPGLSLTDLQRVNHWLLGSGLDIQAMNNIRKSLSAIKGGRLAAHLVGRSVFNLVISDVPGDDLQAIGSGLLTFHEEISLPSTLPDWLHHLMAHSQPLAPQTAFTQITPHLVATPATARQGAIMAAESFGYTVFNHDTLIEGDAQAAGQQLAQQLCQAPPGFYLWSSETTVHLPEQPGQGGRCQTLALAAACELAGRSDVFLLAAGTDGHDGPNQVAGALVDGGTLSRSIGFNAQDCLKAADAGRFLAASHDLIETGPTGTNVMDLLMGVKI